MHGFLLCPRLLDGAVPIWRATRGAFCTYSVQCVHGSTFDTVWTPRASGSCFCSIDVESTLGHVKTASKGAKYLTHAQRVRARARPPPRPARVRSQESVSRPRDAARVEKKRTHTAQKPYTVTKTMYNGEYNALNASCKCQFKWQVPKTRTPGSLRGHSADRARTQAHTHTERHATHRDRTDHSHRARATTKLRGETRRASYAVRAA